MLYFPGFGIKFRFLLSNLNSKYVNVCLFVYVRLCPLCCSVLVPGSRPCHWKGQPPRLLPAGCSLACLQYAPLVVLFRFSPPVFQVARIAVEHYHCCVVVQVIVGDYLCCCVVVLVVVEDYRCSRCVVLVDPLVRSSIALVG